MDELLGEGRQTMFGKLLLRSWDVHPEIQIFLYEKILI